MTEEYTAWFLPYLQGTLAAEEAAQYRQRMAEDAQLRQAFDTFRKGTAYTTWTLNPTDDERLFQQQLKQQNDLYFPDENSPAPARKKHLLPILATALLLCLLFYGIYRAVPHLKGKEPKPETETQPIASLFDPMPVPAIRGDTQGAPLSNLERAWQAYQQNDDKQAAKLLATVPDTSANYSVAQLFLGYSLFKQQQYESAITAFQEVTSTQDSRFVANAQWHTLLCSLAKNDSKEQVETYARPIVTDPNHPYHQEAKERIK